jgi:hypothetical protein
MIQLGKKGKDKITGFEGIIIGRAEYLTGCTQYGLAGSLVNGEIKPAEWFDEGRIEITGNGVLPEEVKTPVNGGPNRDAPSGGR